MNRLKKLVRYLFEKKSEIKDLDVKDALLAKTILDIHRKRTHSEFVFVPLFSINPIHVIDRETAIANVERRIETLLEVKEHILEKIKITRSNLSEYLPSVSGIKVVKQHTDSYISYEGNGRLMALQSVFTPEDGIQVEVEVYYFKNPRKILQRMNKVRKLNGFIE